MTSYNAPLADMVFLLKNIFIHDKDIKKFHNFSEDLIEPILSEANRLASEVFHPLNKVGDSHGCILKNNLVFTSKGFKEAYNLFCDGGWSSLSCHEEFGGQEMPSALSSLVSEIFSSSNMALTMYVGLTHGAYSAIYHHGSEEQKKQYLPFLASGRWSGTMNLTEPQAGTDLGLVKTKANRQEDGSFKITGEKIFISAGEHDLSENIIHLVLARIDGAAEGVKGISLFIVPKFLPDTNEKNSLKCTKLEEKMGIHGNATCAMSYDGATGFLIGEENRGLQAMFTMMNEARLGVAIQGLSQSEIAYQNASAYAKQRPQGRHIVSEKNPDQPADMIIHHPDVKRMLLNIKSFNFAARSMMVNIGYEMDRLHHPNESTHNAAELYIALMTPVAKGFVTDMSYDLCTQAQQIFGGYGYIKETGIDQFVRDSRITMIYEGANGIQAQDLLFRKMAKNGGKSIVTYIQNLIKLTSEIKGINDLHEAFNALDECRSCLQKAGIWLMQDGIKDFEHMAACAYDVMHLLGITELCRQYANIENFLYKNSRIKENNLQYYKQVRFLAEFFYKNYVPKVNYLQRKIINENAISKISNIYL